MVDIVLISYSKISILFELCKYLFDLFCFFSSFFSSSAWINNGFGMIFFFFFAGDRGSGGKGGISPLTPKTNWCEALPYSAWLECSIVFPLPLMEKKNDRQGRFYVGAKQRNGNRSVLSLPIIFFGISFEKRLSNSSVGKKFGLHEVKLSSSIIEGKCWVKN